MIAEIGGERRLANAGKSVILSSMRTRGAYILRENTGTSGLEQTLRHAIEILAHHGVPHLVVGGLAVQEHGYSRVTIDCDLVVPDVLALPGNLGRAGGGEMTRPSALHFWLSLAA
jgi:hypothetical protein